MDKKLTTSEIIILVSGAVALVFSFLAWFGEGDFAINAWDEFPLLTYIAIFGVLQAGHIAATKFGNVNLPDHVLGFTWRQIHVVLGLFAVLIGVGVFIAFESHEIGFWISFLAAIGLLVGAIMQSKEPDTAGPRPGTAPPTPF